MLLTVLSVFLPAVSLSKNICLYHLRAVSLRREVLAVLVASQLASLQLTPHISKASRSLAAKATGGKSITERMATEAQVCVYPCGV